MPPLILHTYLSLAMSLRGPEVIKGRYVICIYIHNPYISKILHHVT